MSMLLNVADRDAPFIRSPPSRQSSLGANYTILSGILKLTYFSTSYKSLRTTIDAMSRAGLAKCSRAYFMRRTATRYRLLPAESELI